MKNLQKGSKPLQYVISSCDRMLFAIITEDTLSIWYSKPSVQIVSYIHPYKETVSEGTFKLVEWKPDSSMIAVLTSKLTLLFFKVELDVSVPNHHCLYVQHEGRNQTPKRDINGIPDSDSIPAIRVTLVAKMQLPANITCCLCVREELMVATEEGSLHRIKWNASVNQKASFHIRGFPAALDFHQTKACKLTEEDGYVQQMEYSPIIGGYTLVLSSGKALFVIPPSIKVENSVPQGVWVTGLTDATCVAVNHRYRLMAFGCKSGIGAVYVINEVEGTIELSYKLHVSSKDYPDACQKAGPVKCMKWTPDGTAVAVCWKNGGFSLWSVFGALLLCSLGGDLYPSDSPKLFPPPVLSMEWGLEGYQLWVVCQEEQSVNGFAETKEDNHSITNVMQLQFVKSALTVNPCVTNHEHVFLQGEDRLYMSISDGCASQDGGCQDSSQSLMSIGNKIWQIIPISHTYLGANWPIRYAAVDKTGQCVAVAGKTGLAHYTFSTRKWKLFGNETQEKDLVVSGGMTWWKDFICVACYNIIGQRDEIRCYPKNTKLDNTFAVITKVPSQILLLNTFRDILIIFCIDSHIMLYNMERKNSQKNPLMELIKIQEVSLGNYIPHPVCVSGLALTSLRTEKFGSRSAQPSRDSECLLLNVAGKLLMFQRDEPGAQVQAKQNKAKPQSFGAPAVVATNVENMWSTSRTNQSKSQLMEALWLGCGAQGMKVWLPLYPKHEGKTHNFMSKRIMLPFRVDIYPLAVLFEDAVILGAASDGVTYKPPSEDTKKSVQNLPFCIVERTSQIYLHHILRQLLRRNLGVNALDLARCCTELSYFPHVLELLLHEVLEAEATSKEPIPDPLLPRVVAFIQEFPEFLQTIVHCARKTEVALWPHLFSVVGNPKELFEQCIVSEELETAASYLIILQNLERPIISRQHATLLLDQSLERGKWDLARDLVRFLKAIDPSEASTPPILTSSRTPSSKSYHSGVPSPPIMPSEADGFSFSTVSNVSNVSNVNRLRSSSMTGADYSENVPKGSKPKLKHTFSDNIFSVKKPPPKPKEEGAPDQMYIDMILCRHCRKLLETNHLRDMGYFSANTEDFHLVSFLKRERLKGAKVEDFVRAVKDIHHQFEWPLPILSYHVFQQLKNKTFSTSSLASLSLLDAENLPTVNVGAHNNDTEYHRYLGTLQSPSPLNLSQNFSNDVELKPQVIKTEESSLATTLDISDTSSLLGELDYMTESSSQDTLSPELEILSQEMANKGPRQSEMELRYLLQILLEAGCLEWALIISLVLRDVEAVVRTVNTASMTDTPLEMVARMREGISYLELWADTECLGYKPFLHFIRKQIQVLGKLAEQTPPTLQLSTSVMNDESSDSEQLSPVLQTIHTKNPDSSPELSPTQPRDPAKASECVIS